MKRYKIGNKVIVNPTLQAGNVYGGIIFSDFMHTPGIFSISELNEGSHLLDNGYYYSEEMLLPVPLFKAGDKVQIRRHLDKIDDFPFGFADEMRAFEGITCTIADAVPSTIERVLFGYDEFQYRLKEDPHIYLWPSVAFDLSNYKFKTNNYESRLQEQESPLRRGSREISGGVCCRINRARVEVSTLGYKKIFGRG